MRVIEFTNLEREDVQIFYIRKYSAIAVIELPQNTKNLSINFSIEMDPLGQKQITLKINDSTDYPLLPLRKSIIEYITNLDKEGKLPC